MRRRDVLGFPWIVASAAMSWPAAGWAQQAAVPVIGLVESGSAQVYTRLVGAFGQGLQELGYLERKNVAIEQRWAEGQYEHLPALLADLIARNVDVIVTTGGTATALAAKAATSTIPVVFAIGGDPVKLGLVATFSRPGGNITGVSFLSNTLVAKRIELLHEIIPGAARIGLLVNPTNPNAEADTAAAEGAVSALAHEVVIATARTPEDLESAFRSLIEQQPKAIVVFPDALFTSARERIVEFAAGRMLPAIYSSREYTTVGGLMSYGADQIDAYRRAGTYAARILKGERPAELPVEQSTKIKLVLNLKTAKALGLAFPITLLGRADEAIE